MIAGHWFESTRAYTRFMEFWNALFCSISIKQWNVRWQTKKKSFAFPLIQIDFLFGHSFNDNDTSLEESRNRKQTKESPLYDSNGDGDAVRASQCLNNSFFNHCAFLCLLSLSPSLARSASLHKLIFSTVLSSERFVFSVCLHLATNMQWSITTNISRPIIDRLRNQAFTKSIEL